MAYRAALKVFQSCSLDFPALTSLKSNRLRKIATAVDRLSCICLHLTVIHIDELSSAVSRQDDGISGDPLSIWVKAESDCGSVVVLPLIDVGSKSQTLSVENPDISNRPDRVGASCRL